MKTVCNKSVYKLMQGLKTHQKLIAVSFVVIMFLLLITVVPVKAETTEEGFSYVVIDGTAQITDYEGEDTEVVIPDSIDGYKVTSIGDSAFGFSNITSIKFPDGIVSIGDGAFQHCHLTSIEIPSNITSIGKEVLRCCYWLSNVKIPDHVVSIGEYAFLNCTSLTSINIPDSITSIGFGAFEGCSSLTGIKIPTKLTSVSGAVFWGCSSLNGIDIPTGVTSIGEYAFAGCSSFKTVKIPDGVKSIGSHVFEGCSSLISIDLPNSITSVGDGAFSRCESLTGINLPDGITCIDDNMFYCCSSLASIEIPNGVTNIGWMAFYNCSSLTYITIPGSVTEVVYNAFSDCPNLKDIYFEGTNEQWEKIQNSVCFYITNATIHINESIDGAEVILSRNGLEYNGKVQKPTIRTINGKSLKEGTDYIAIWSNPSSKDVGVYSVTITGKGNYTGSASAKYWICFTDVPLSHSFQKAVYWSVNEGIAAGYSGDKTGTFGVGDNITRGQVVMFLWRAANQPKAKDLKTQSFSDVKTTSAFYKAIQWAVEEGITAGYSDGTFRPSENCTRGQIAQFLWRYAGKPAPQGKTQTFSDVPTSHGFYKAVQWASEQGITAGYKDGTFGVNKSCTRGHCVTFLYRLSQIE